MDHQHPTRRQFVGFLGLAMLSPVLPVVPADTGAGFREPPVYLGPVRELLAGVPLGPGWRPEFDALIESAASPASEWALADTASVHVVPWAPPVAEMPGLLRERGVARACEATFEVSGRDGRPVGSYGVDLTLFDSTRQCELAWRAIATVPAEAGFDPLPGVGEAAAVSRGGWSLPGKIFFRRANVLASVVPYTTDHDARGPAMAIDRRLGPLLRPAGAWID